MAEYIERQTVVDMLQNLSYDDWNQGVVTSWANAFSECAEMILDIPPADVRPVVRGKWIKVGGFYTPGGDPVWECSECGKGRHVYGVEHGTYGADISDGQWVACPNCGAEMEGGESDG